MDLKTVDGDERKRCGNQDKRGGANDLQDVHPGITPRYSRLSGGRATGTLWPRPFQCGTIVRYRRARHSPSIASANA
jgi:hypothetical protein